MLPCNKSPECGQEAVGSRRFIRKNARGVDPWRTSIPAFLRLARTGIAVALVSLAFALPLCAQDYNAPTIAISPGGGLSTTASLSITIEWCDDSDLQRLTRTITLNDVDVRSSFDFVFGSNPSCGAYATSTGSVTLSPGSNVLSATIMDIAQNAGGGSAQFTFGVSVTPDAGSAGTVAPFSAQSYGFIVTNTGSTSTVFNLTATCSVSMTGCWAPSTVTLSGGAQTTVPVSYSVGASGTAGSVSLNAAASGNSAITDDGSVNVTVSAATTYLAINTSLNNFDNHRSDLCEISCFAVTHAVSTVPYFSLDQPRSVTLVYNGDAAAARPIVATDVQLAGGAATLEEYWLEAKDSTGTLITFANGDTKLRFAAPSPQTAKVRLAGQFDASAYTTGVYPVTLIATAKYSGSTESNAIVSRFLVVNEQKSPIARGWSVAGVSRLFRQGNGALITDGTGSGVFFAACGSDCFTNPPSEFSQLSSSGTGTGLTYTRIFNDLSKVVYDYQGRLLRSISRSLDTTSFRYDGSGRLSQIDDPFRTNGAGVHLYTTLTYGTYGLSSIQEPGLNNTQSGGRTTSITVASDSTLTTWTDPDAVASRFGYDASRRLSKSVNRHGDTTTVTYNASSWKIASTVSPSFAVDPRLYGAGQTRQLATTYSPWQTVSLPTSSTVSTLAPAVLADTIRGSVVDPGGHVTASTVDRWGQSLVTTIAPGTALARVTTVYRRSLKTFADSVRHHEGGVDRFTYDESRGLPVSLQMAGQNAVNMRYGANAQVDSIWGTGTPAQRIFLGLRGRADSVRTAGAYTTRYTYDSRDRVVSAQDPSLHTTYLYHESIFGNRDSTRAPGNRATKAKFDGMGRDTAARAGTLPWQVTTYDQMNRAQKKILATTSLPDTTIFTYDNLYLTQVRDAAGNIYGFAHNPLGLVTQKTDPASNADKYFYDAEALATTWVNRRSDTLKTSYDALHRRLSKNGNGAVADSFFYATDGRWSAAHNKYSRDTVFTAATGWTDSIVTRLATDWSKRLRVSHIPSSVWQLDSIGVSSNMGIGFVARRYFWNTLKSTLDSVAFNGQKVTIGYDTELMPSTVTQPGGVTRSQSVTSIHDLFQSGYNTIGIDTLLWRSAKYDPLGRMSEQYSLAQSSANKTQYVYKYDERGRLVAVHDSTLYYTNRCDDTDPDYGGRLCAGYTPSFQWRDSLAYDRVGNATYIAGTAGTGSPVYDKNRITSWPGYTFTRDSAGNVASRTNTASGLTTSYHWSADGLLDSVTAGSRVIQYDYNAFGQLVRKRVNGTIGRHLVWDQGHLFAELDGALASRVAEYAYYPGTDRPLAIMTGATAVTKTAYYHQDAQGNVIGLVTSAGAVDGAAIITKPWGEFEAWVPGVATADTNRLRWKGLIYEGDSTQLYYVRARWYDPVTHRFLTQDPIGLEGGVNPYVFAGNDPVNRSDPSGMFAADERGICSILAPSCGRDTWAELAESMGGRGQPTACQKMAAKAGEIAARSKNTYQWAREFTQVTVGTTSPWGARSGATDDRVIFSGPGGFKPKYDDHSVGDQVNHFGGYILAASWGLAPAAMMRDMAQRQLADLRLGAAAAVMWASLQPRVHTQYDVVMEPLLSLEGIEGYILANICAGEA